MIETKHQRLRLNGKRWGYRGVALALLACSLFPATRALGAETSAPQPGLEQNSPAPAANDRSGLRIAGIVVASVGAVALGTGVIMNMKANTLADQLNSPTGYERNNVSNQLRYQTLSWVGYGLGAACLISGTVLYLVGSADTEPSKVALRPVIVPGLASLSLQGAF
jgi:hypothetical protein